MTYRNVYVKYSVCLRCVAHELKQVAEAGPPRRENYI